MRPFVQLLRPLVKFSHTGSPSRPVLPSSIRHSRAAVYSSEIVDDVVAVAARRIVGVDASNADVRRRVGPPHPTQVVVALAVVVVASSSSSDGGARVVDVVVVDVVVSVFVVVVVVVVDVLVGELERHAGRALALEQVLDDGLRTPAELVPASRHHRPTGAHAPMSLHESYQPDEREQRADDTVDELQVAEVRLQLCACTTSDSAVLALRLSLVYTIQPVVKPVVQPGLTTG